MKLLRIILFFLCTLISLSCFSQGGYLRPNTSYGTREYRRGIDSAFFYPTGSGAPTSLHSYDLKQGALYFDSTNNKVYNYNPKTSTWTALGFGDVTDGESGLYKSSGKLRLGTNPLLEDATIPTNSHNLILSGNGSSAGTFANPDYTLRITSPRSNSATGALVSNSDSTSAAVFGISGDSVGISGSLFITSRKYVPSIDGFYAQPRRMYLNGSSSLNGMTIRSRNATSNIIMQIASDSAVIIDTSKALFTGNFGIGQEYNDRSISGDPAHKLNVIADNQYLAQLTAYAPNAGYSNFHIRKARGSWASPSAVQSGDFLVSMGFRGYDGTGFAQSSGAFQFLTTENFDATHNGTMAQLSITANGRSNANRTIAMKWNQDSTIDIVNTLRYTSANAIPLSMTRTPNTTYGIWDFRLTGDPQGLGTSLNDASLTIHNGRGFGDFGIATNSSAQPNFIIKQNGNVLINGTTDNGVKLQNNGTAYFGTFISTNIPFTAQYAGTSGNSMAYFNNTSTTSGISGLTTNIGATDAASTSFRVNSGGTARFSVNGDGAIVMNSLTSGSLTDSIITQNVSTSKLNRISPNRFTLQSITDAGNLTTNNVLFGGTTGANVSMYYSNSSGFVLGVTNSSNTSGAAVANFNTVNSSSSSLGLMVSTNGVSNFDIRGDGTANFMHDVYATSGTTHLQDGEIRRHLFFTSTTPTVTLGSGVTVTGTYSITGTDQSGVLAFTVTSGTASIGASGTILAISFGSSFVSNPRVIVVPADINTANTFTKIAGTNGTSSGWNLSTTPSMTGIPTGQYFFNYHVF